MANYFYLDASGRKQGPINDQQLRTLAAQGVITPQTQLETDSGHKGLANQIPGLNFPVPTTPQQNSSIPPKAAAIPKTAQGEALNRQTFIILALFGGWTGVHQFYANRKGAAIANIVLSFILLAICFFASECHQRAIFHERYGLVGWQVSYNMMAYYWLSFAFVVALVVQIVLIIKAIAYCKTDGNGIPMKE